MDGLIDGLLNDHLLAQTIAVLIEYVIDWTGGGAEFRRKNHRSLSIVLLESYRFVSDRLVRGRAINWIQWSSRGRLLKIDSRVPPRSDLLERLVYRLRDAAAAPIDP